MRNDSLILHVRLTLQCNADCSYCSSYDESAVSSMPVEHYKKSIDQIKSWILSMGLGKQRKNLTIQYIGGELLTIPPEQLSECVHYARAILSPLFEFFRDGAQTNLIGSQARVQTLIDLFGPNSIGTSVDSFGSERTVKGNPSTYRTIYLKNQNHIKEQFTAYAPAILVVDQHSLKHLPDEIAKANKERYHLTLRPVFQGGMPNVKHSQIEELIPHYVAAFRNWAMKQRINIQPFYQLLASRIGERFPEHQLLYTYNTGCPFQHDCAYHSLDLEPNGDVYVCLDMADSHQYKLGNTLDGVFDLTLWNRLADRSNHLANSCQTCPYLKSCQGGCMSEAIHHTGDPFGKTEYCSLWKALFAEIDLLIDNTPIERLVHWLTFVSESNTPKQI